MKTTFILSALAFAAITPLASAHCQVPCGIYSDATVFTDLHTHLDTITKSMKQINELSKDPHKNANQLVRWVNNKETHAQKIQDIVAEYFLAQRVKLDEADKNKLAYQEKLALLHQITVYAMKCKQTTDTKNADKLHNAIDAFQIAYSGKGH